MDYKNIIFDKEGDMAIIKFNRPKALNAINPDVIMETNDALDKIEDDQSIKVLILTGEGEKAFVAGADIAHMVKLNPLQARRFSRDGQELMLRLERLPIPVIACVNGFALGGGIESPPPGQGLPTRPLDLNTGPERPNDFGQESLGIWYFARLPYGLQVFGRRPLHMELWRR